MYKNNVQIMLFTPHDPYGKIAPLEGTLIDDNIDYRKEK